MVPRKMIHLLEHDIGVMASWIERTGYGANLKELRLLACELEITITSLSTWLHKKASKSSNKSKENLFDDLDRFAPVI